MRTSSIEQAREPLEISHADSIPDFRGLMAGNAHGFCAWCFDLLMIDGKDVRREPLEDRRARLEHLLSCADADLLRFSEAFTLRIWLAT